MSNFPEKFRIPEDRLPRAWSQGAYDCCATASVTKVLEVINAIKTGKYTMLSKGYTYGRHSSPELKKWSQGGGVDYDYTMHSIMSLGSVPEEMYPMMNEIPNIIFDIENAPNLAELDKEAEKTKVKSFTKIEGNGYFRENVKKYLYEKQMPLVGNMTGQHHCTVIVGWDEDGFEFCDHDGRVDETTGRSWVYGGGKFNKAFYLDGGIEDMECNTKLPFNDVSEDDWYFDAVKQVYEDGVMNGITETEFAPNKPLTRAEFATVLMRLRRE